MHHQLAQAIQQQTKLAEEDAKAIANTVQLLPNTLTFDPSYLLLHPSSQVPKDKTYFYQLAMKALKGANANACSSILAGQGSESDDTGDVAFWIGKGDFSKAENVLAALGLSGFNTKIEKISAGPDVNSISSLADQYSFLIRGPESRVFFFMVGRDAEGGWGGLAGAGVWT